MRLSPSTTSLLLATTLTWVGWSAAPAEAQFSGPPQYQGVIPGAGQGQYAYPNMAQNPYMMGQSPYMGQNAYMMAQNPYAGQNAYMMAQNPEMGQDPSGGPCPCADGYAGQDQAQESPYFFPGILDPGDCGPRWLFSSEFVEWQRTSARSQPLLRAGPSSTDPVLLSANDLNFPVTPAFRIDGIRRLPCGWDLEIAYFQLNQVRGYAADTTVPGASFLVFDSTDPFRVPLTNVNASYFSSLYSGEINLGRQWTDWLNLMIGFRAIELDEQYQAGAVIPFSITMRTNTFNHLYGFQVGGDVQVYNRGGPLEIHALCKGGIYGNAASQNIELTQQLAATRNDAAFFGEADVVLTYALTCHVGLRAAAEAAWLTGVALAPEQINMTNFTTGAAACDTSGNIFYYGGSIGMECRF